MFEDGEIKVIPLDAPIDVESADSFNSIQDPKLTHNRQKLQGGTLPSSVRFEHNGYACGWDVYNFELTSDLIPLIDSTLTMSRVKKSNVGLYEFIVKDDNNEDIGRFKYLKDTYIRKYSVLYNIAHQDDNGAVVILAKHKQLDGTELDLTITLERVDGLLSGAISITTDPSVLGITPAYSFNIDDSSSNISIVDKSQKVEIDIDELYLPGVITNSEYIVDFFKEVHSNINSGVFTFEHSYTGNMINIKLHNTIDSNDQYIMPTSLDITPVNDDLNDLQYIIIEQDLNILHARLSLNYVMQFLFSCDITKFINYVYSIAPITTDQLVDSQAYDGVISYKGYNATTGNAKFNSFSVGIAYDDSNKHNTMYYNNETDRNGFIANVQIPTWSSLVIIPTSRSNGANYNLSGFELYKTKNAKNIKSKLTLNIDGFKYDMSLADNINMYDEPVASPIRIYLRNGTELKYDLFCILGDGVNNMGGAIMLNPYYNSYNEGDFTVPLQISTQRNQPITYAQIKLYYIPKGSNISRDITFVLNTSHMQAINSNIIGDINQALSNQFEEFIGNEFIGEDVNGNTAKITIIGYELVKTNRLHDALYSYLSNNVNGLMLSFAAGVEGKSTRSVSFNYTDENVKYGIPFQSNNICTINNSGAWPRALSGGRSQPYNYVYMSNDPSGYTYRIPDLQMFTAGSFIPSAFKNVTSSSVMFLLNAHWYIYNNYSEIPQNIREMLTMYEYTNNYISFNRFEHSNMIFFTDGGVINTAYRYVYDANIYNRVRAINMFYDETLFNKVPCFNFTSGESGYIFGCDTRLNNTKLYCFEPYNGIGTRLAIKDFAEYSALLNMSSAITYHWDNVFNGQNLIINAATNAYMNANAYISPNSVAMTSVVSNAATINNYLGIETVGSWATKSNAVVAKSFCKLETLPFKIQPVTKITENCKASDFEVISLSDSTPSYYLNIDGVSYDKTTNKITFSFSLASGTETYIFYATANYNTDISGGTESQFSNAKIYCPGLIFNNDISANNTTIAPTGVSLLKAKNVSKDNTVSIQVSGIADAYDSIDNALLSTDGKERNYNNNDYFKSNLYNALHNCTIAKVADNISYDGDTSGSSIYNLLFVYNDYKFDLMLSYTVKKVYADIYDMLSFYRYNNDINYIVYDNLKYYWDSTEGPVANLYLDPELTILFGSIDTVNRTFSTDSLQCIMSNGVAYYFKEGDSILYSDISLTTIAGTIDTSTNTYSINVERKILADDGNYYYWNDTMYDSTYHMLFTDDTYSVISGIAYIPTGVGITFDIETYTTPHTKITEALINNAERVTHNYVESVPVSISYSELDVQHGANQYLKSITVNDTTFTIEYTGSHSMLKCDNLAEVLQYTRICTSNNIEYALSIPLLYSDNISDMLLVSEADNDNVHLAVNIGTETKDINISVQNKKATCSDIGYTEDIPTSSINVNEYYTKFDNITLSLYQLAAIKMYIRNVFNASDVAINALNTDYLDFTVNGQTFRESTDKLFSDEYKNYLIESYVDTTEKELKNTILQKINTDDAFTFIRQAWNTSTEVLNYWWLNDKYLLSLSEHSFVLKEKIYNKYDAWLGNKFNTLLTIPRTAYLNSDIIYYAAANGYKSTETVFFTISSPANNMMQLTIYKDIKSNFEGATSIFDTIINKTILLNYKRIGDELNTDNVVMNTYSDIDMRTLLSKATISATLIEDNTLVIGIHYDCNFNQWAIILDMSDNTYHIIQGYGYVGVNGDLTGGEIPSRYFDVNKGFNSTVNDLKTLDTNPRDAKDIQDIYTINETVVGNDTCQWYISSKLSGIVSSIPYPYNSTIDLPISNNYDASYASPSFSSYTHGDIGIFFKTMQSMIPGASSGAWTALLALFGYPIIYYIAPKFSMMVYLQQTGGQTAYVHYNSTDSVSSVRRNFTKEDMSEAKSASDVQYAYLQSSDSTIFDTRFIKQTLSCNNTVAKEFFALLASMQISAVDYVTRDIHIDRDFENGKDLSFTWSKDDKSYSSILAQNMDSKAMSKFRAHTAIATETSEITMTKSLDMFYSTSDTQHICAGPGYVNHNFVAQCVTQSFTSCQMSMSQHKLMFIITALTTFQIELEYVILDYVAQTSKAATGAWSGEEFVGFASSYTLPLKLAALVVYGISIAAKKSLEVASKLLPKMIDAMGGNKLQATLWSHLPVHENDYEPKHRYGSKTEMYMYPCDTGDINISVTDECVKASCINKTWKLNTPTSDSEKKWTTDNFFTTIDKPDFTTDKDVDEIAKTLEGDMPYYIFKVSGVSNEVALPDGMSVIQGVSKFLPDEPYKNKSVGDSNPVFATPVIHDYIINKQWKLTQTASGDNGVIWLSCNNTKLIDGAPSNIFITEQSCLVASNYCALEILNRIDVNYLRPTLITPESLAINISKYNVVHDRKTYNAFDGTGYRIAKWIGESAMVTNKHMMVYSFIANDRFKRSNKLPPLSVLGNFKSLPSVPGAIADDQDRYILDVKNVTDSEVPVAQTVVGEDFDTRRYSIPIFTEPVATLPAQVKTIESYQLAVYDGITSLCTDIRNTQSKYKVPLSVDFNINKSLYRFTKEYICSVQQKNGVVVLDRLVPTEGLTFLGATPYEAFLYSKSNRMYYTYSGGTSLQAVDMIERFRNVALGRYDFIEQSVAMECLTDMSRIDSHIDDDHDETDNVFIANLKNGNFDGEVCPPNTTIFNEESWFKVYSLPSGIVFQGPNRCHIHRNIPSAYMLKQIRDNLGKWQRVPKEYFHPYRVYPEVYTDVTELLTEGVKGWTHNPFVLVTSMLGADIHTDCKFEWEITFTWTDEMDEIYSNGKYACVNIMAETITQGGKVSCRPTHIYLTKELFNRAGNQGYYSFRFQSNNGAGNRERLFVWSDAYIALNEILLNYKPITQQRTSILTQQVDIQNLSEL